MFKHFILILIIIKSVIMYQFYKKKDYLIIKINKCCKKKAIPIKIPNTTNPSLL